MDPRAHLIEERPKPRTDWQNVVVAMATFLLIAWTVYVVGTIIIDVLPLL